jgi:hypothetical protein
MSFVITWAKAQYTKKPEAFTSGFCKLVAGLGFEPKIPLCGIMSLTSETARGRVLCE